MTNMKTREEAKGAVGSPRVDWSSKLDWNKFKPVFPIQVLQTKEGELYVFVDKAGVIDIRMKQRIWAKLIGPLDAKKPLKEQLEGVGPWMEVEQTKEEMRRVMDRWNSMSEGAFSASVDLSDMLNNEAGVLAAIKSCDRQAVEKVCPNPYIMRRND